MPLYEYECNSCSHRFEKRQSFSDDPSADCPECKSAAKRVFHPAPIIFKGSGFYVTDHRKNSSSESSGSSGSSTSSSPSTSTSSSSETGKSST